MDFLNSFPGSWPLVRKNLPALLGAGVGAIASTYAAGRRAYRAIDRDTRAQRLPTFSYKPSMPQRVAVRRPRMARPYKTRRYARSKGMNTLDHRRIVRSTALSTLSVTAASSAMNSNNILLNTVQTSDLTPVFRLYRIRKVVMHLVPRVDAANSGLVNNFNVQVAACCDPESTTAPTNTQAITAYDNSYSKWVTSGDKFRYTFYPKVTNTVDISSAATPAGSYAINPWLRLDSVGITVPHLCLKFGATLGGGSTLALDYYFDIHFDVRGIA